MPLLTEEEAKQRWCPFSRIILTDMNGIFRRGAAYPYNRGSAASLPAGSQCIASDCMAWRQSADDWEHLHVPSLQHSWGPSPGPGWVLANTAPVNDPNGPGQYWAKRRQDRGFCGLAGRHE